MTKTMTRAEFYDLVWSKPMTHLAKEFAVSDVALHKICKKHNVPRPPQGWWAKQAAGHKVEQTPLPAASQGVLDTVRINSGPQKDEPQSIADSREKAHQRAAAFDNSHANEHPLVTKSIELLRQSKADDLGIVRLAKPNLIQIAVATESIDRAEHVLHRIAAAASVQGFEIISGENSAVFTDGKTTIPFRLKEEIRQTKHEPTQAELAKEEKERKRREIRWAQNGWGKAPSSGLVRPWPEWDYTASGMLTVELDIHIRHRSGLARNFRDGKKQRLEDLAAKIAMAMPVLAAAMREDERRDEEQKLRWAEDERRRNEAKRRAYIEERRLKALDELLARAEKRDRLRLLASTLSSEAPFAEAPRSAEFARWLEEKLEQAERSTSLAAIEEMFRAERLFGDDEDSGFNPSRHW